MVLTVGSLGQRLVLEPQWMPVSSQGSVLCVYTVLNKLPMTFDLVCSWLGLLPSSN